MCPCNQWKDPQRHLWVKRGLVGLDSSHYLFSFLFFISFFLFLTYLLGRPLYVSQTSLGVPQHPINVNGVSICIVGSENYLGCSQTSSYPQDPPWAWRRDLVEPCRSGSSICARCPMGQYHHINWEYQQLTDVNTFTWSDCLAWLTSLYCSWLNWVVTKYEIRHLSVQGFSSFVVHILFGSDHVHLAHFASLIPSTHMPSLYHSLWILHLLWFSRIHRGQ